MPAPEAALHRMFNTVATICKSEKRWNVGTIKGWRIMKVKLSVMGIYISFNQIIVVLAGYYWWHDMQLYAEKWCEM